VTEYRREELSVKIVKRMIVIEGRHEDALSSRSFLKKVPIPDGVEPNEITTALAPNGVLVVTAPVTPCQDSNLPLADVIETSLKTHQQTVETQKEKVEKEEERQEKAEEEDFVMVPSGGSPPAQRSPEEDGDMPKEIAHTLNDEKFEVREIAPIEKKVSPCYLLTES